ncbi:MAG: helix-hairpin-helix domain-containing protein [Thermoproteus sp.]
MDLKELEGVGPQTAKKLAEAGITSVRQLLEFTVEELASLGIEPERAAKILESAAKAVGVNTVVKAKDLKSKQYKTFKTFVAEFDEKTPWGGIREAFIYEFAGEFGAGKSMLAHQISVAALAQGFTPNVVYVDTENTFNPSLVETLAERFNVDVEKALDAIVVIKPATVFYLERFVKFELPSYLEGGTRLIVIDTITALYRAEFPGREMLAARQQRIHYLIDWLRRHSHMYGLVSILTNQVMDVPEAFLSGVKKPVGGNVLAHAVNARFMMVRPNKAKLEGYMWPLDVPGMSPEVKIQYKITESGLE